MPLDKIKNPAKFPASFHNVFLRGEGEFLMNSGDRQADAYREARRFRAFLKSLQRFPTHPSAQAAARWHVRTKIREDPVVNQWDFYVILEDCTRMLKAVQTALELAD